MISLKGVVHGALRLSPQMSPGTGGLGSPRRRSAGPSTVQTMTGYGKRASGFPGLGQGMGQGLGQGMGQRV